MKPALALILLACLLLAWYRRERKDETAPPYQLDPYTVANRLNRLTRRQTWPDNVGLWEWTRKTGRPWIEYPEILPQ